MMNSESQAGSQSGQMRDTADRITDQIREKSSDVADQARETAKTTVGKQKGRVADSVGSIADALRTTGHNLEDNDQDSIANFAHMAADRLERFSDDLQHKSVDQMFADVENFARRDPQLFLGGALLLGLFASRFFKSTSSRSPESQGYPGPQQYPSGGMYQPGTRYYRSTPARRYEADDLADYRRDTLRDEYTGRPRPASGGMGQSGTSESFTESTDRPAGSSTNPDFERNPGMGSATTGFNPPASTRPGAEHSEPDTPGWSGE